MHSLVRKSMAIAATAALLASVTPVFAQTASSTASTTVMHQNRVHRTEHFGTVSSVDQTGNSFVMDMSDGKTQVTINVGTNTTINFNGSSTSFSTLAPAMRVHVWGTYEGKDRYSILTATRIDARPAVVNTHKIQHWGTVSSVGTSTIDMVLSNGKTHNTIVISSSTEIKIGTSTGSLSDLTGGMKIHVKGTYTGHMYSVTDASLIQARVK